MTLHKRLAVLGNSDAEMKRSAGVANFERLMMIFAASQVVWKRMQATEPCCPEWWRLRNKYHLLASRYRLVREMSEPRTIN